MLLYLLVKRSDTMAYESYCAACTYMNESEYYGKYYCTTKGEWRKASDPKCYNYCEAYGRSNGARENMYYYSSRYYITTAILNIVRALDNNYQIKVIGDFIEKMQPAYFVYGHNHLNYGRKQLKEIKPLILMS